MQITQEFYENQRVELITQTAAELVALRKKIADATQDITDLRSDADKVPQTHEEWERLTNRAATAGELEKTLSLMTYRELPALVRKAQDIQVGTWPELLQLNAKVRLSLQQLQADMELKAATDFVAARVAWREHIAKLATAKTFLLAKTLSDSAKAVNAAPDLTVDALLSDSALGEAA